MNCRICEVPITNPLCPECLGTAIGQWLEQEAPERAHQLPGETNNIHTRGRTPCIKCKQGFNVCTYCYTKHIFNWLRQGELQIRYLQYFNFLT